MKATASRETPCKRKKAHAQPKQTPSTRFDSAKMQSIKLKHKDKLVQDEKTVEGDLEKSKSETDGLRLIVRFKQA